MRRRYNGNHKLLLLENQNPQFLFHLRFSVQCDLKKSQFELKSLYGQKQKPKTNILTLAEIHILVKYLITVSSLSCTFHITIIKEPNLQQELSPHRSSKLWSSLSSLRLHLRDQKLHLQIIYYKREKQRKHAIENSCIKSLHIPTAQNYFSKTVCVHGYE